MKRIPVIAIIASVSLLAFAFSFKSTADEEVTIKVSAAQATEFDMYQEHGKISRGLKTPYQFTADNANDRFIFKSLDQKTEIKVTVDKKQKTVLMGQWPIVVLLLDKGSATTFGID